jgi:hypothetical protein
MRIKFYISLYPCDVLYSEEKFTFQKDLFIFYTNHDFRKKPLKFRKMLSYKYSWNSFANTKMYDTI